MVSLRRSERRWSHLLSPLLCGVAGITAVTCGFSNETGTTGSGGSSMSSSGPTSTSTGGGSSSTTTSTTTDPTTTTSGPTGAGGEATTSGAGGDGSTSTGGAGGGSTGTGMGGAGGVGGSGGSGGGVMAGFKNYELTGTWPALKAAIPTAMGKLAYRKVQVHNRFLGESCSIADYNNDGNPDVSSGRRWYEGPNFTVEHIFRGGHDDLPRAGDSPEITEGVSDDWSDFPWDINGDGLADIINIASSDANTMQMPNPRPQTNATAFWYRNPGPGATGMWVATSIHGDVRHEQHGFVDVDGDGKPEIYGACKGCNPQQTKGYYQANWANPAAAWTYRAVTTMYTFPFGGTGWMHGLGFGDVNGDGKPDLLERGGAWLQQANGTWNVTVCPAANCGWIKTTLYDGDPAENRGGSHMYSYDVDGDGDADIVSADWAHGWGLAWYEQTTPNTFVKHPFMGSNSAADQQKFGSVFFSEPHAMQAVDMDGDGVPDIVTGKMRFAHPVSYGDPDPMGTPYLYVFKTVRNKASVAGSVTFEPHLVDNVVGVGRQLSVGQINTDGIVDICIASKLGLFVFFGQ